jgi:hypothetical protein
VDLIAKRLGLLCRGRLEMGGWGRLYRMFRTWSIVEVRFTLGSLRLRLVTNAFIEVLSDDALAAREAAQYQYKTERKLANDRLAELVPRADVGTHERRLEKKQDIAAVHSSFRDVKEGGAEEIPDTDLLGDGGLDEYKRRRKEEEMRKSDRQIRREEHERARDEERRERGKVLREKEDQTMAMLRGLAQQRFG